MKLYKTGGYKELIEEVEAIKATDKTVWLSNGRSAKRSNYANYWDTIEEAKEYLEAQLKKVIKSEEIKLEKAKSELQLLRNY